MTRGRYDARVVDVVPYQPGERTDVVAVRARFSYAYGAAWWCEDAPGPDVGARYLVTIEPAPLPASPAVAGSGGTP